MFNEVRISAGRDMVAIEIPGLGRGTISLRTARLAQADLAAAVSMCILPTPACRWEEPTQAWKDSAILYLEDSRYADRFGAPSIPVQSPRVSQLLRMPDSKTSRIVGYVLQQTEIGDIQMGFYIAAAAPDFTQVSYSDFEDAQCAVAQRLKSQGIS